MGLLNLLSRSGKNRVVQRLEQILHQTIGLKLVTPSEEILPFLAALSDREVASFETVHSIEGVQELFRVKSIHAIVDRNLNLISLFPLSAGDTTVKFPTKGKPVKILHVGQRSTPTQKIITEDEPTLGQTETVAKIETKDKGEIPEEFQHLSSVEQLCLSIVDLLVKHGQLTISDKEILTRPNQLNAPIGARIETLERWQSELTHRIRAFQPPKLTQSLILEDAAEKNDESNEKNLVTRFDHVMIWLGKFIKAFESTGVRFHNKPVWLPR